MPERSLAPQERGADTASSGPEHSATPAPRAVSGAAPWFVGRAIEAAGTPLDGAERSDLEERFGHDLSRVRIHRGAAARVSAYAAGASAYTIGDHVVLGVSAESLTGTSRRALLAHEVVHVIQQRGGGPAPGQAAETEAVEAAGTVTVSGRQTTVESSSALGVARSVEDWLTTSRNIAALGYTEIVGDIDEIDEWLARQTMSTPESARLEEARELLVAERQRRERRSLQRRRRRRRRRARASAAEEPAAEQPMPRILRERTSVQYRDAAEVNTEVDLIMAWLERDDVSRADRSLLRNELRSLDPQVRQGRAEATAQRRSARLQRVFDPATDEASAALRRVTQVIREVVPSPDMPGVYLIYHQGEQIPIAAEQVRRLRADVVKHLRRGASQARSTIQRGFERYSDQVKLNEESPIISSIAGWLGDAGDPGFAMAMRAAAAEQSLIRLEQALESGDFTFAALQLAGAERRANEIEAAARKFNEAHIEGASLAVGALEITRDVSFAIAGSIAAVVAAPVVAAGVAGTGATGVVAGTATALGTGTVVGTGSAVVRGGSAGLGELAAGGSFEDAATAARREGKRGFREGAVAGVTGGAAHSLGARLVAGRELSRTASVGRRLAAEGGADVIGGATDVALQGGSASEILEGGVTNALLGAPGTVAGGVVRNRALREATDATVGSVTAAGGTLATGGSREEAIRAGAVSLTSRLAVGRARSPSSARSGAEERAYAAGRSVRATARSVASRGRSLAAATMLGVGRPLGGTRIGAGPAGGPPPAQVTTVPPRSGGVTDVAPTGQTGTVADAGRPSRSAREIEAETSFAGVIEHDPVSYRSTAAAARGATEAGLADLAAGRAGMSSHSTASTLRREFGLPGRGQGAHESAHLLPQDVGAQIPGYSPGRALTVLLPKGTHSAIDAGWVPWWKAAKRSGQRVTAMDVYRQISGAIDAVPDAQLTPQAKGALIHRLQAEMFVEQGLSPDQVLLNQ